MDGVCYFFHSAGQEISQDRPEASQCIDCCSIFHVHLGDLMFPFLESTIGSAHLTFNVLLLIVVTALLALISPCSDSCFRILGVLFVWDGGIF